MKNLNKSMALVAAIDMSASMLAGCNTGAGDTTDATTAGTDGTTAEVTMATTAETQPEAVAAVSDGKEFVFYAWNEEFKGFMEKYYLIDNPLPAGVTWAPLITTGTQEYINKTDAQLAADASSAAADKIDLLAAEFNYIKRYVDVPYTMPLTSLGLTQAELDTQVEYTLATGIDASGVYKAISFQTTPMLFAYRKSTAEKVLGTSDPAEVGAMIKDWAGYEDVSKKMLDAGVAMNNTVNDLFWPYANSSGGAIVAVGSEQITIPAAWDKWVDDSKARMDAGYAASAVSLWDGSWTASMVDGSAFCYAGPAWLINFTLEPAVKDTPAYGDYLVTTGPVASFWGGTWLMGGASSDNTDLVADVMRYFCVENESVLKVAVTEAYTPSNLQVFEQMAAGGAEYGVPMLGGQNPYDLYLTAAKGITGDMIAKEISVYGLLAETYQGAYGDYFNGTIDKATALENFYTNAQTAYSNLKR
ncbi:MAG: ABC transporter substrate-binding protein [Ruminococcus sp.]|jgi:hypothetical protein|nr:ABC transporter substrate-binding protein [Ruminococcus sp.]